MPDYFIYGYLLTTTLLVGLLAVLCLLCWKLLTAVENFSRIVSDNAAHVEPLVQRTTDTLGLVQTTLVDTQQVLKDVHGRTQGALGEAHKLIESANNSVGAIASMPGMVASGVRRILPRKEKVAGEPALNAPEALEGGEQADSHGKEPS